MHLCLPGRKKSSVLNQEKWARMQPDPHRHITWYFSQRLSEMFTWQIFGQVDHSHRLRLILERPKEFASARHNHHLGSTRWGTNEPFKWFTPFIQLDLYLNADQSLFDNLGVGTYLFNISVLKVRMSWLWWEITFKMV